MRAGGGRPGPAGGGRPGPAGGRRPGPAGGGPAGAPRRRPLVKALAGGLALAGVAGGCTSAHNSLGTGSSPCFSALPAAETDVHHQGTLLGIRRLPVAKLGHRLAQRVGPVTPGELVCVAAFRDRYQPGSVDHQVRPVAGPYATVVVTSRGSRQTVVAAFVSHRLPLRFRHL